MLVFRTVDFSDKDHSTPRSVHEKHFLHGVDWSDWSCETSGMSFFYNPILAKMVPNPFTLSLRFGMTGRLQKHTQNT